MVSSNDRKHQSIIFNKDDIYQSIKKEGNIFSLHVLIYLTGYEKTIGVTKLFLALKYLVSNPPQVRL